MIGRWCERQFPRGAAGPDRVIGHALGQGQRLLDNDGLPILETFEAVHGHKRCIGRQQTVCQTELSHLFYARVADPQPVVIGKKRDPVPRPKVGQGLVFD